MLTLDQVRQRCPAVFSETPAPHVSEGYKFIPTSRFLEAFIDSGWGIQNINSIRPSKKDPLYVKHMLDLSHRDFGYVRPELGEVIPRITLVNSHDWSSKFSLFVGLFRLICTNGMMANFGSFAGLTIRHDADIGVTVAEVTEKFKIEAVSIVETASRWKGLDLTQEQQLQLATAGGKIRWGDEYTGNPTLLNIARRTFDSGENLWNTFNRIQENMMKGGMVFNGRRNARAVRNIDAIQKSNTQLWDAASQLENEITLSLN
jgi:hypothetical protein